MIGRAINAQLLRQVGKLVRNNPLLFEVIAIGRRGVALVLRLMIHPHHVGLVIAPRQIVGSAVTLGPKGLVNVASHQITRLRQGRQPDSHPPLGLVFVVVFVRRIKQPALHVILMPPAADQNNWRAVSIEPALTIGNKRVPRMIPNRFRLGFLAILKEVIENHQIRPNASAQTAPTAEFDLRATVQP